MYNLVNPEPIQSTQSTSVKEEKEDEEIKEEKETEEMASLSNESVQETESSSSSSSSGEQEVPVVSLKDLSLLYKITERQGWYVNKERICYFIRFNDSTKKQYDVIFQGISNTDLDSLIRQVGG